MARRVRMAGGRDSELWTRCGEIPGDVGGVDMIRHQGIRAPEQCAHGASH